MPPEEIGFHLAIRSEIDIHAPREIVWDWLYRPQEWKPSIVSLERVAGGRPVRLVARPRSASPAEGSSSRHSYHQQLLVDAARAPSGKKTGGRAKARWRSRSASRTFV